MTDPTRYTVPKEPGRWRAIALAAVVHAALFAFLWFGVRWQNETPVAIEAEIWSPQPREAAPRPEPQPEPQPEPEPVQKPEPKPVVKEPPKPQVVQPPVAKQPNIALEQEKKRKLQKEKERIEEERLAKLEQKAEEKRLEKEKTDAAKKKLEAEQAKKVATDKKRKLQLEAEAAVNEARRQEDLKRLMNQAGAGGTGEAPKAQGGRAEPGYAQRVGAKIKSNINFNIPDDLAGNSPVEYRVELLPDGSVAGMQKTRSSGVPGFDEAVRRAIEKSQPYPKDKSGSVPSSFIGTHRPKDQ